MKLLTKSFLILLIAILLPAFSPQNNINDLLLGKWNMEQVVQGGEDVTGYHNPYQERWILFNENNTFISDGRPYSKNTGIWKLNLETNELSLINDSETSKDSYWIVSFPDSNKMIWEGARSEYTKDFRIYYSRGE